MAEMFVLGGWGMWPTLLFGLVSIAVAIRYAVKPERRIVPLMITSSIIVLISGLLGFSTGVTRSLLALDRVGDDRRWIGLIGIGESMMNVNLAMVFLVLAAIIATIGALRIATSTERSRAAAA